mmetsp:Transcript_4296/g.12180  ORF Transcript_4296/g.12180 Transcript_4296/m.12180 type:complete len:250 (-) Transcript_4296:482-1231(-)
MTLPAPLPRDDQRHLRPPGRQVAPVSPLGDPTPRRATSSPPDSTTCRCDISPAPEHRRCQSPAIPQACGQAGRSFPHRPELPDKPPQRAWTPQHNPCRYVSSRRSGDLRPREVASRSRRRGFALISSPQHPGLERDLLETVLVILHSQWHLRQFLPCLSPSAPLCLPCCHPAEDPDLWRRPLCRHPCSLLYSICPLNLPWCLHERRRCDHLHRSCFYRLYSHLCRPSLPSPLSRPCLSRRSSRPCPSHL